MGDVRAWWSILGGLSLAVVGLVPAAAAEAPATSGTLAGQVVPAAGYSAAGMELCPVQGSSQLYERCVELVDDGSFTFTDLAPGYYGLKLADPVGLSDLIAGYYPSGEDMVGWFAPSPLEVTAGATTSVQFTAKVGGVVAGTVQVPAGYDPRDLTVHASWHESANPCDPYGGKSTSPAADGTFRIGGLTPREHVVSLSSASVTDLVLGHFPGNSHWCSPDEVLDVVSAETYTGVSFNVQLGGSIAGTVTNPQGAAVVGAAVNLCDDATAPDNAWDSWLVAPWQATTGNDGSFLVEGLPAGTYRVTAASPGTALSCSDPSSSGTSVSGIGVDPGLSTSGVDIIVTGTVFLDVPASAPFAAEISWLASAGISTGYADGTFHPLEAVSRQAMAAFLYRYAGSPPYTEPATPRFTDVPVGAPFSAAISWLAEQGITTGYADGSFHPTESVSRQAMAAFLYRYAQRPAFIPPVSASFNDVPLGAGFLTEVEWLASTSITTGYADHTFHPVEDVSRQAMAAFLFRYDSNPLLGSG